MYESDDDGDCEVTFLLEETMSFDDSDDDGEIEVMFPMEESISFYEGGEKGEDGAEN